MARASKTGRAASNRRTAKPASKSQAPKRALRAAARAKASRARVRMYRQGFGDCFLVTLPRARPRRRPYHILIDCGVLLGTDDAKELMTKVVLDVILATKGEIDLLVVTHEHWDHVSGFIQAAEEFSKLKIHEVWLAWTEDPDDELARKLRDEHEKALTSLRVSMQRMALAGDGQRAAVLEGLLGFFGAKRASTRDALDAAKSLGPVQYKRPKDAPVEPEGVAAHIYVLGPPPDEKAIRRIHPSRKNQETYGLLLDDFTANIEIGLGAESPEAPFASHFVIPLDVAREMAFFKSRYSAPGTGQDWRRIDTAWLGDSSDLALKLDSKTNNTSLVLAIELSDGEVLLFAADAQVGNWLSWHTLSWTVDGRKVTGPDLLRRAVLYKVGHHGSHNATLREKGVELMTGLRYALVPVDADTAKARGWNGIPLAELIGRLKEMNVTVLRADVDPSVAPPGVMTKSLYYEIDL